jgi:hypothetical protein
MVLLLMGSCTLMLLSFLSWLSFQLIQQYRTGIWGPLVRFSQIYNPWYIWLIWLGISVNMLILVEVIEFVLGIVIDRLSSNSALFDACPNGMHSISSLSVIYQILRAHWSHHSSLFGKWLFKCLWVCVDYEWRLLPVFIHIWSSHYWDSSFGADLFSLFPEMGDMTEVKLVMNSITVWVPESNGRGLVSPLGCALDSVFILAWIVQCVVLQIAIFHTHAWELVAQMRGVEVLGVLV